MTKKTKRRIVHLSPTLDVPGPPGICWQQDPKQLKAGNFVAPRCTLKTGHTRRGQPHTWERKA